MRRDQELAWAAGFFEGEGTVRINKPTKRNTGHLVVSVVNTDIDAIRWFQSRWPGYFKRATGLDYTRQRPAWVWVIAALVAANFLQQIRPFIVRPLVAQRIDHALEFQAGKKHGRANRTPEYAEDQWNAYWWMCELNRRGPGGGDIPRAFREHEAAARKKRLRRNRGE